MNRTQYEGIKFGFTFLFIWLILLTGFVMYDKMNIGSRVNQIILPPPQLEIIGDLDYGYNE